MVPEILKPLNINKVHGIGKKSKEALNNIGIYTVGDLLLLNKTYMVEIFGKHGLEIYDRINGIDNREVEYKSKTNKSVGKETTLKENTADKDFMDKILRKFSKEIISNLKEENLLYKTITVKYKTENFDSHTKSRTLNIYNSDWNILYREALKILLSINFEEKIRLIGLSVSNLIPVKEKQISFFD
jgi:DNA polymerase-4